MKILKIFILVSLLLAASGAAMACGPYYFSAADCHLYRLFPPCGKDPGAINNGFAEHNIMLWSEQTGCNDTAAIRKAIYEGTLAQWEDFYQDQLKDSINMGWFSKNAFVLHLYKQHDVSAQTVLFLSKWYESIRNAQRSPWYYNSRLETDENKELQELYTRLQQCKPFKDKYADRYTFLEIKCSWAMEDDNRTIALWEQMRKKLKSSIFYEEAGDYAARSLVRLGKQAEAEAIYRANKNYLQLTPTNATLPEKLRIMLSVCPDSPQIISVLQDFLSEIDQEQSETYRWYQEEEYTKSKMVLKVAKGAIDNPNVHKKAIWRYTAACILDYQNKHKEAMAMLRGAENGDGDVFLQNAVRILTFHLRCRTNTINNNFEQYAIGEIKWMNEQLQHEWQLLPNDIQKDISCVDNWRWISDLNKLYFYSALRRIVLADNIGLSWRMADAGRNIRALQIANMTDNWIISLTDNQTIDSSRHCSTWIEDYWGLTKERYNWHDYSNGLFVLADNMSASTIAEYHQRLSHPQDDIDRWFNARSYADNDYWQDIIGTHYLRERNYPAAIAHLEQVSPDYQRRMNLRCHIDPFSIDRSLISHDSTQYKLHFAQRMDSLQHVMLFTRDADQLGLTMLEYSIGLENCFDMCWWITSYQKGMTWSGPNLKDIGTTTYAHEANAIVKQLRKKALRMLSSDDAKARYHIRLGHYQLVQKQYASTPTGKQVALVCDERKNYHFQR